MKRAIQGGGPAPSLLKPRSNIDIFDARNLVVFSSPITEFVKFGGYLLIMLEDGTSYLSDNGTSWKRFAFTPLESVTDA